ncbi:hypothetical protein T265_07933 [Opisthorchis viverrini]|uniref:Fibronectin type-III domain-containing protein n=1 Tax=Opisthorchis viverrini TaxID=6198 RepID=A0A074ZB74_OPIVI|nr:hypothetical protein T265_07933 [Opisthorchis viverrini]KER24373.1 hypothetical protein T265_07933 [Opisthorchis viverrini]
MNGTPLAALDSTTVSPMVQNISVALLTGQAAAEHLASKAGFRLPDYTESLVVTLLSYTPPSTPELGLYAAHVENTQGCTTCYLRVQNYSVPEAPSSVHLINITDDRILLSWIAGYHGGYSQKLMVRSIKDQDPHSQSGGRTVVIPDVPSFPERQQCWFTGLRPGSTYYLTLYGENKLGAGPSSEVIKVKTMDLQFPKIIGYELNSDRIELQFQDDTTLPNSFCIQVEEIRTSSFASPSLIYDTCPKVSITTASSELFAIEYCENGLSMTNGHATNRSNVMLGSSAVSDPTQAMPDHRLDIVLNASTANSDGTVLIPVEGNQGAISNEESTDIPTVLKYRLRFCYVKAPHECSDYVSLNKVNRKLLNYYKNDLERKRQTKICLMNLRETCHGTLGLKLVDGILYNGHPFITQKLSSFARKIQYRSSGLEFRNQACNGRHSERIFDETMFGFISTKCNGGAFTKGRMEFHNLNVQSSPTSSKFPILWICLNATVFPAVGLLIVCLWHAHRRRQTAGNQVWISRKSDPLIKHRVQIRKFNKPHSDDDLRKRRSKTQVFICTSVVFSAEILDTNIHKKITKKSKRWKPGGYQSRFYGYYLRLKHEAAWCSTFSCLRTSRTRDSAGFQVSLSKKHRISLQMNVYSKLVLLLSDHRKQCPAFRLLETQTLLMETSVEFTQCFCKYFRPSLSSHILKIKTHSVFYGCTLVGKPKIWERTLVANGKYSRQIQTKSVNRSSQPGQLLGRRSMSRAHQSHRSSVNTFACSDVIIQMRPTCVGGVVVIRLPRMSDVRGSNPRTIIDDDEL